MNIELTKDEILRQFGSGDLLQSLAEGSFSRPATELSETENACIGLHNGGLIDVLALTNEKSLASIAKLSFFECSHAIERLIPHLSCTATAVMEAVERLVAAGGNDGAANIPNGSLLAWFHGHPDDARSVVNSAREGEPLAIRHVVFALQALKDTDEARRMAKDFDDERRTASLTALSRIEEADSDGYGKSIELFGNLLSQSSDDQLKAQVLHAAAWMLTRGGDAGSATAQEIICRASKGGGVQVRWAASLLLFQYKGIVESDALDPLMDLLAQTQPDENGTLRQIDVASAGFKKAGKLQRLAQLVRTLIQQSGGKTSLETFSSFLSSLSASSIDHARLIVTWLLSGNPALCRELLWLFQHSPSPEGKPIVISPEVMPASNEERVFVAHKAVGWLIVKPVTTASILLSLLRASDGEAADEIADLLTDLLLANYDCVQRYLETYADDPEIGERTRQMLTSNQIYLDGLKSVPALPELKPSEAHRGIQHERRNAQMRELSREARKQSIVSVIATHATILHGAGSLTTIYDAPGQGRQVVVPFHTFEYKQETARMQVIDLTGLEMMLSMLRMEGRTR